MVHKRPSAAALACAFAALVTIAAADTATAGGTSKPKPVIDSTSPQGSEARAFKASGTYNPYGDGSEPTLPYAQPAAADVPKRGCTTTVSNPTAPPSSSTKSIQFIYAWHEGNGNRYDANVQQIAKLIDRIDWALDNSSDYDQHLNTSCRSGYNTSDYDGYAKALLVPEKIEAGNLSGSTSMETVRADLAAAGYNDPNRWYFVFQDFAGESAAYTHCTETGGEWCYGVTASWDSGVAGHELAHLQGAQHAWSKEDGGWYGADVMSDWENFWMRDQDFASYYDPSEPNTFFFTNPHTSGVPYANEVKFNTAKHPTMSALGPNDLGFSNDLLSAQERTIEADAPGSTPTGFGVTGGAWIQVTPQGADSGVSAKYYDGRRSMTVNVQPNAEGVVSVTNKPAVKAGARYKLFARLNTAASGNVKLRLSWFNSSNALISNSDSSVIAVDGSWAERSFTAVAPTNAKSVKVSVVSPSGQSFAFQLDTLQLNHCNNTGKTPDGCRTSV